MAPQLLLAANDVDANKDYLPSLASGELIATVAIAEDSGSWSPADVTATATESGGSWTLSGHKSYVIDGAIADVLLVAARTDDGLGVFAVDRAAAGMTRVPLATMDQTRKQARIEFKNTPARLIGSPDRGQSAIETMLDHAMIALAADSLGGTAKVLDMSVDYAKVREQFGRPIGSFQAIKHKCANMLVEVESSKSATYYAAWAVANDVPEAPLAAAMAKAYCSDAYRHTAGEGIQIHGGIGFTWEHDMHIYFKRAKSSEVTFGDATWNREIVAQLIGL